MTELDPGVSLVEERINSRNDTSWKDYRFTIDGESFEVDGPFLAQQPSLFGEPEDTPPAEIDEMITQWERQQRNALSRRWIAPQLTLVWAGVANLALGPLYASNNELMSVENLQVFGVVNGALLAVGGIASAIIARSSQQEADRCGTFAERYRRVLPFFESRQRQTSTPQ